MDEKTNSSPKNLLDYYYEEKKCRGTLIGSAHGVRNIYGSLALGVFPHSQRASAQARTYTLARATAKANLQEELAKDPASVVSRPTTAVTRFIYSNSATPIEVALESEVIVSVVTPSPFPPHNVKNVESIVRWNQAGGIGVVRREVKYNAWIAE